MFEKEAEEYQTRKHHQRLYGNKPVVMKELNITYKDGFKDGYNKANEWHYVKDEKPKDDGNFICMLENGYKLECYYDPTNKRWYDNFFHHDTEYGYYQSKVIAWKEIVLPKEK